MVDRRHDKDPYTPILGDNLRIARNAAGLDQQEVADRLGVTRVTVSNHERGATQPDDEVLAAYAKLYRVTLSQLRYGHSPIVAYDTVREQLRAIREEPGGVDGLLRLLRGIVARYEIESLQAGATNRELDFVRATLLAPETAHMLSDGYDGTEEFFAAQENEILQLIHALNSWLLQRISRRQSALKLERHSEAPLSEPLLPADAPERAAASRAARKKGA